MAARRPDRGRHPRALLVDRGPTRRRLGPVHHRRLPARHRRPRPVPQERQPVTTHRIRRRPRAWRPPEGRDALPRRAPLRRGEHEQEAASALAETASELRCCSVGDTGFEAAFKPILTSGDALPSPPMGLRWDPQNRQRTTPRSDEIDDTYDATRHSPAHRKSSARVGTSRRPYAVPQPSLRQLRARGRRAGCTRRASGGLNGTDSRLRDTCRADPVERWVLVDADCLPRHRDESSLVVPGR